MAATTIPITSLSPSEAPPASKSIRAVVSLLWPYSSSTKQCALLLADPDFRLRNRKGQVRVRFTGASAEAVAKGRIGIGDELVLELGGAQWAGEQTRVATPGKSVDGELVFGGQLALSVTRKANGDQSDLVLQVNETTPPPEEPEQSISNGNHATPARAAPSWMRASMGGADVTPIYSSPAFVKRLRLSGGKTSWDPFADDENESDDDAGPRKRQRISFGGKKRWKLSEGTPSPGKEMPMASQVDEEVDRSMAEEDLQSGDTQAEDHAQEEVPALSTAGPLQDAPVGMPPPPLPRLQLPSEVSFVEAQQSQQGTGGNENGPSTPKLHPVPSSALPLPSPFPTEASQVQFGIQKPGPSVGTTALDALAEVAGTAREAEPTSLQHEDAAAEEMSPIVSHQLALPDTATSGLVFPTISTNASLASTAEIVRDEEPLDDNEIVTNQDVRQPMSQTEQRDQTTQHSIPEYLSDTEEDEEMYYDHMRRRFPSVTESGRVRVDHQEEGYYDDLSQVHEDDVEEVIDPDAMGEEPASEDSGDDASDEVEVAEDAELEASAEIQETPQPPVVTLDEPDEAPRAGPIQQAEKHARSLAPDPALNAMQDAREELRKENHETLKTPAGPPPGLFGFDGAANDIPFQPKSTPQSEKDRIMKKTYSSLFGFRASPSPEFQRQPQPQTPTPAMPVGHLSQIAKGRLEFAGTPREEPSVEAVAQEKRTAPAADLEHVQDPETRESPSPAAVDVVPTADAVNEVEEATEETGESMPVADVQDGSLLAAINADEALPSIPDVDNDMRLPIDVPAVEEPTQSDQMPVKEAPQVDVEMQDVAEDPVPDGLSINQNLGEAIAPDSHEDPQHPPASSAPKPTQVTVIDLGDSSDDEEQPAQVAQQSHDHVAEEEPAPPPQQEVAPSTDFARAQTPPLSQAPHSVVSQYAPHHTTQDSQGSALQSDMLDTTQTTVDRSEIVTPVAEDFNTIIPDTSQEDALWLNQGQQDGFFADQMPNQEFEGAAMPQLTQQATAATTDPYRYFSFQSATSVATDNSDNLPPTAVQSFAQEEEVEPAPTDLTEEVSNEEIAFEQESMAMQLDPALAVPTASGEPVIQLTEQVEIQETPQDDTILELGQAPVSLPELEPPKSVAQTTSEMEADVVEGEDLSQEAEQPEVANIRSSLEQRLSEDVSMEDEPSQAEAESIDDETQEESQPPPGQTTQVSYPALPISPEESQHRVESQPFETQMPLHRAANELPPTPKLTQGDSLTENEVQVIVEEADEEGQEAGEEAAPPEPTTPPRTRSHKAYGPALESPAKKTPVRRSPRKTQTDTVDSVAEESQQGKPEEPSTSQRRRRSVQHLTPAKQTPARRSPRKAQAATEVLEEVTERDHEERSDDAASQSSPHQPSLTSVKKTPIRRSPRKSQADSQTSEKASEDLETMSPVKPITRHSAKKEQAYARNGDINVPKPVQEAEEMEDTISVTPPAKATTRQSAKRSEVQIEKDELDVKQAVPAKTPTTSRKSFTSQLGRVPAVISNWFSPRRSSRPEQGEEEPETAVEEPATLKQERSNGFHTALSYFTPLSNLEEKVNPASQYQTDNTVDVLAVVTDETKAPERAKGGPRDYFTIFRVTDSSLGAKESVRAEVFRPWHSTLPMAQVGDVVLLRAFAVKTRKRQPYLLSTDASAWCVWRYAEDEGEQKRPATRKRGASFSATSGTREVIKGPPVEFGEEERERAAELRKWWLENKKDDVAEEVVVSPRSARATRSQKL